jgi:hypothetical protein
LRAYFDNVQHYLLLEKVARRVQDDDVMRLLKMILKATGKKGVFVISPLPPFLLESLQTAGPLRSTAIDGVTFEAIEESGGESFLQQIRDELVSIWQTEEASLSWALNIAAFWAVTGSGDPTTRRR